MDGNAFSSSVFDLLDVDGSIQGLKAQLRASLIEKLLKQSKTSRNEGLSKKDDVVDSLIYEHLEANDCQWTLSVFVPERKVTPLGRDILLDLLGPTSLLPQRSSRDRFSNGDALGPRDDKREEEGLGGCRARVKQSLLCILLENLRARKFDASKLGLSDKVFALGASRITSHKRNCLPETEVPRILEVNTASGNDLKNQELKSLELTTELKELEIQFRQQLNELVTQCSSKAVRAASSEAGNHQAELLCTFEASFKDFKQRYSKLCQVEQRAVYDLELQKMKDKISTQYGLKMTHLEKMKRELLIDQQELRKERYACRQEQLQTLERYKQQELERDHQFIAGMEQFQFQCLRVQKNAAQLETDKDNFRKSKCSFKAVFENQRAALKESHTRKLEQKDEIISQLRIKVDGLVSTIEMMKAEEQSPRPSATKEPVTSTTTSRRERAGTNELQQYHRLHRRASKLLRENKRLKSRPLRDGLPLTDIALHDKLQYRPSIAKTLRCRNDSGTKLGMMKASDLEYEDFKTDFFKKLRLSYGQSSTLPHHSVSMAQQNVAGSHVLLSSHRSNQLRHNFLADHRTDFLQENQSPFNKQLLHAHCGGEQNADGLLKPRMVGARGRAFNELPINNCCEPQAQGIEEKQSRTGLINAIDVDLLTTTDNAGEEMGVITKRDPAPGLDQDDRKLQIVQAAAEVQGGAILVPSLPVQGEHTATEDMSHHTSRQVSNDTPWEAFRSHAEEEIDNDSLEEKEGFIAERSEQIDRQDRAFDQSSQPDICSPLQESNNEADTEEALMRASSHKKTPVIKHNSMNSTELLKASDPKSESESSWF